MMLFLRSLAANLYFYPAMALGFLISLPIGVFSRKAMINLWDRHLHRLIWNGMLKLCGITIEVRGKQYITPGVIFASKHESAFETYSYTDIIPHSVFVLKKELTYIPLFGWGQALYGMIPVDRGAGAKAMKGMLDPVYKEVIIGNAEVRQIFKISDVGTIAGCYVTNGKVARNAGVRVIRDNVVIHDGKLISLKRMKDDAKEVASGYECGIQIEDYNDIKEGDIIEAYVMEQVKN